MCAQTNILRLSHRTQVSIRSMTQNMLLLYTKLLNVMIDFHSTPLLHGKREEKNDHIEEFEEENEMRENQHRDERYNII